MLRVKQKQFVLLIVAALVWNSTALAQTYQPIKDPDTFAAEVHQLLANGSNKDASNIVAQSMGDPSIGPTLEQSFTMLVGKKFDFSRKVVDYEFNGALRQIIYYSYVDPLGFLYFRFNFKNTSTGWMLTNFSWKSETNELFPKDFQILKP